MAKKILIALVLIAIVLAVVISFQPEEFRVVRSTTINAPAAVVFDQVNDLHKWEAWSPWAKLDPNAKNSFEGAPAGKDAIFTWSGDNQVGEGKMTIVESKPNQLVRIKLEFVRPFACTNNVDFTFQPNDDKTAVTWDMSGPNNFMSKAMHLVMDMDKMVGAQFEQGLASMKSVAEAEAKK